MDPIDLLFQEPLPGGPVPLDLVFGQLDTGTSAQTGTLSVALQLPGVAIVADYDHNNAQRMYGGASSGWQTGQALARELRTDWTAAGRLEDATALPWRHAEPLRHQTAAAYSRNATRQAGTTAPWGHGIAQRAEAAAPHAEQLRHIRPEAGGRWQEGIARRAEASSPFADQLHHIRAAALAPWRQAEHITRELLARVGTSARRAADSRLPWQEGRRPPAGITILPPIEPPIDDSCYTPPTARAVDLYLGSVWLPGTALYFSCTEFDLPADLAIPYRRVYVAAHTITATTHPGGAPVPLFDSSISTDADSYCWTLSATGPLSLMDQLAPSAGAPAQIKVTIDGIAWVFAVEKIGRTRAFGQARTQIMGRSVTGALDVPWAPSRTWGNANQVLAAQIVDQAVDLTGITAEWGVDDWLVPAGAWSHLGTPLSAIRRIAESIGAILHSHPSIPKLQIMRRYPMMPWEWYGSAVAPDVQLPLAAVLRESYERRDSPAYNRAIVSGTTQGILGVITRSGTAGDLAAPMVSDALITAPEPALERARSILGQAGRQALIALDLPVLTGGSLPGVLQINQLAEVIEPTETWRGLVRGVQVMVSGAKVRQTITIERNLA